jgi:hypothetical protein
MSDYVNSLKGTLGSMAFLKDASERAIKTAMQAAGLVIGQSAAGFNLMNADVPAIVGFAAGGFLLSFVTSIASALFAGRISPASLVKPGTN